MSKQIKIFTDFADNVILCTQQQHSLEVKLIMLGFEKINLDFNRYAFIDYQLKEHFIRINLNNNTYSQNYRKVEIKTHLEINNYAINAIVQKMEAYNSDEYN